MFRELELERRHVEMGPVPRERTINGENARELALFSLRKIQREEGREENNTKQQFSSKTHIIIKKSIIGIP